MSFKRGWKRLNDEARKTGRLFIATLLMTTLVFSMALMLMPTQLAWAAFPGANGKIAFDSIRDGDWEIFVMNSDGSGPTQLTFIHTAVDAEPAWSPDGSKIAFMSDRDGEWEIFVMNSDGSGQTQLTFNTVDDMDPDWQPIIARPVGGVATPVDKLSILTPYLALIGLIGAVAGAVGLIRRRKS